METLQQPLVVVNLGMIVSFVFLFGRMFQRMNDQDKRIDGLDGIETMKANIDLLKEEVNRLRDQIDRLIERLNDA